MITIAIILTNVEAGGTKRFADEISEAWKQQNKRIIYVQAVERIIHIKVMEKSSASRNVYLLMTVN